MYCLQGLCTYTAVGVDGCGLVSPEDVVAALTPNTVLVSIMHSNNEVGGKRVCVCMGRVCVGGKIDRGSLATEAAERWQGCRQLC